MVSILRNNQWTLIASLLSGKWSDVTGKCSYARTHAHPHRHTPTADSHTYADAGPDIHARTNLHPDSHATTDGL